MYVCMYVCMYAKVKNKKLTMTPAFLPAYGNKQQHNPYRPPILNADSFYSAPRTQKTVTMSGHSDQLDDSQFHLTASESGVQMVRLNRGLGFGDSTPSRGPAG